MSDQPSDAKLGEFLREVSNMRWDEFAHAEHDETYTSNQAMVFGLIRACAMENLQAIKLSVNRLDGKLATPIKIEYPKIYYLYPLAKSSESPGRVDYDATHQPKTTAVITTGELLPPHPEPTLEEADLLTLSLRQTVTKMAGYPRKLPDSIVEAALHTEQWLNKQGERPGTIPLVKSVVAAHLLILAQKRNIEAINEVFDQVDGKLVETLHLLGEDIFITSYVLTAPEGAYFNKKGVLEMEASKAQDLWAAKLGKVTIDNE